MDMVKGLSLTSGWNMGERWRIFRATGKDPILFHRLSF